ncbi:MAG: prephenate dehydrogenase [Clostridia bacterium]|nr:prephenate dehydrogenase [Clostridia bacterium]
MTVGIVGLGLIGASLAKALKAYTTHTVRGFDVDAATTQYAKLSGIIDNDLPFDALKDCDYVLLAAYPQANNDYLTKAAPHIASQTVVLDCGGIKREACGIGFAIAKQYGFTFIGGHPMAGLHRSGIKYATEELYQNASMILTPPNTEDIGLLERVSAFIKSMGFGSVTVTTPAEHDRIIAFTSQLAHVVSNAYVKSPTAEVHRGFSAGSYQDLTRVARLNESMWSELFLANRDNLVYEIDTIMETLAEYRKAIAENNREELQALLRDGSQRKERIDCEHATH